ncbi:MAG TPA: ABC transporter permease [Blastocatellia bacterium]|nr:ABC transporter permease [Blastocatellia bacterium]
MLIQDIRYAVRMLFKNPGLSSAAIITLALGIGANTAIFSVVNSVLLAPLGYSRPAELISLWTINRQNSASSSPQPSCWLDFVDWRQQNRTFEQLAATRNVTLNLTDGGQPIRITAARATPNLLSVLGLSVQTGRDFREEEGLAGAEPVVLIGYGLWRDRYGSDPSVVGRTIDLDGKSHLVAGVLPRGFAFPERDTALLVALVPEKNEQARGVLRFNAVGRIKGGVSLAQAAADMSTIAGRIGEQYPNTNQGTEVQLIPLHEQVVGNVRPALLVLLGAVACVLLIACANVANLLLARAEGSRTEVAIRTALGASRWRLIRQLLTESAMLSISGGLIGLLLAFWTVPALTRISSGSIPRVEEIAINGRVLLFTLAVSLATGILFGLAPALKSTGSQFTELLKEGRRGSTGGIIHQRVLSSLVIAEIALALILMVGAGLMIRSFESITRVAPGFNPRGVVAMGIGVATVKYPDTDKQSQLYQRLLSRLETVPGVQSAAGISRIPLSGASAWTGFSIQGRPVDPANAPIADYRAVTPKYFSTMEIPFLAGRDFTDADKQDSPLVMIINEAMASQHFLGENPVGKRVQIFPDPNLWREVVGVVGNVKLRSLDAETLPTIYVPFPQNPYPAALRSATLVTRTSVESTGISSGLRGEIQAEDSELPVPDVRRMEDIVGESLSKRRLNTSLLIVLAALAASLAMLGIYGVVAYTAAQRTREIGIRTAMGARRADVVRMVLLDGVKVTGIGVIVGLGGALALTRVLASLLFATSATDPVTFAAISILVLVVSMLASLLPAMRASRVDPVIALRCD